MISHPHAATARRVRRAVLWLGVLAALLAVPGLSAPPGARGQVAAPPPVATRTVPAPGPAQAGAPGSAAPQPTGLTAVHRSGQTFLTWQERSDLSGESYHVYRSAQPITAATLSAARQLTSRWGALPEGSSIFWSERSYPDSVRGGVPVVGNYVISDLGPQLPDTTGLFVWTPKEAGLYYYAVTTVVNGIENVVDFGVDNSLAIPINEVPADPAPVRIWQSPDGYGTVYTQFLDYETYNPTLNLVHYTLPLGATAAPHPQYAFNYSLALPAPADCADQPPDRYPLVMVLHGYGSRYRNTVANSGTCAVFLYGDDPGNTWYFGESDTWDFRRGAWPTSGAVVNYTEERLLRALYDTERGYGTAGFPIDPQRRYVMGGSMGASGALSFGLRYPKVFAAIYANLPMTNPRAADRTEQPPGCCSWYNTLTSLWGDAVHALPVRIIGRYADSLQRYNGMSVWDWQNHQQLTLMRRGEDTALLAFAHGTLDTVIHWQSQAKPFYQPLYQSRRTFSAAIRNVDHATGAGSAGMGPMVSGNFNNWQVRRDESVPALTYASGSGAVPPPDGVPSDYNLNLEWGASWHAFPGSAPPVDTRSEWGIDLRTTDGSSQTVDVTPRRLQHFTVDAGATYHWTVQPLTGTAVLTEGYVTADAESLVTVPGVPVDGAGIHLRIRRSAAAPTPTPVPPTATATPPGGTPGPGCVIQFTDVQPGDYFYAPVQYLYCHGWISGYSDNTFRPANTASRGQVTKIVVLAFGLPLVTPATPTFSDVAPGDVFDPYIETAAAYHLVNGYSDGTFRPFNNVSRGQFAKILVNASGWSILTPDRPDFADVGPTNPFYSYVETAYAHGVISGYSNFTFRPFNNVTRAQIAKIIYNAQPQPLRR
jgi:hypothetical protein